MPIVTTTQMVNSFCECYQFASEYIELAECASVLADFVISLAALTTQREVLTSIFHNIRSTNFRDVGRAKPTSVLGGRPEVEWGELTGYCGWRCTDEQSTQNIIDGTDAGG